MIWHIRYAQSYVLSDLAALVWFQSEYGQIAKRRTHSELLASPFGWGIIGSSHCEQRRPLCNESPLCTVRAQSVEYSLIISHSANHSSLFSNLKSDLKSPLSERSCWTTKGRKTSQRLFEDRPRPLLIDRPSTPPPTSTTHRSSWARGEGTLHNVPSPRPPQDPTLP